MRKTEKRALRALRYVIISVGEQIVDRLDRFYAWRDRKRG